MNSEEISVPTVPIVYVLLTIQQAEERGIAREALLRGVEISNEALETPDARVPFLQYGRIVARALRLTNDPSLGYEFGLRAGLTSHGLVGLGVMSHRTLGDALRFGGKYFLKLRSPGFTHHFFIEERDAVIDMRETVQYGPLRQYAVDVMLVGFTHFARAFLEQSEFELWFDSPEPAHYAAYASRLPRCRFNMGANQFRCPAKYMMRPGVSPSGVTAKLVADQCDRDLALLGSDDSVLERVRRLLRSNDQGLPDLESVAEKMAMSSRTLKRRLSGHGFKFRDLLDEVRRKDSVRLLNDTGLSVEEIGRRVGYTAHGNFIRAFRRWTGTTPGAFRAQARQVA